MSFSPPTPSRKTSFRQRFGHLGNMLLKYKRAGGLGILALTISNAFDTVAPMFLREAVDSIRSGESQYTLWQYATAFVLVVTCGGVARYFVRQTLIKASRSIEYDIRSDFFGHLLRLSRTFYHRTPTGDLITRATSDVEAVRQMIGPGIMQGANTIIVGTFALSLMMYLDWRLTLYALSPLLLMSVIVNRLANRVHTQFTIIQEHFAILQAHAQESFAGIRVVKAYTQERTRTEEFDALNRQFIEKNMRMVHLQALFMPALSLLIGASVAIVLYVGGTHIVEQTLSLGSFVAFSIYLGVLTWPTIALGWVVSLYQRGSVSTDRLNRIIDTQSDVTTMPGARSPEDIRGKIEIRNLTFRYSPDSPDVLRGINMDIEPGQTVAIVGPTGSGKSTLIHLLSRLYEVPAGTIIIDGQDVVMWPLHDLRRTIGCVPQESFLFSNTLRDNIAFGFDLPAEVEDAEIKEAARWANLANDIDRFPKGYDTMVGERGITLSGGQKQRASLARALILNPKILILDDAFASVDTHTEEAILSELRTVTEQRTTILISHRVSTVKESDTIYVLDEGQICESGTHAELVAAAGLYADMYRKQLLETELEDA